jgi:hypothetical protein
VGHRVPVDDEGSTPAGDAAKEKTRESRPSSRDGDDQAGKMRRSRSTGRRMSTNDEGGANPEEAPKPRQSRAPSRGSQSISMRRSKSVGRSAPTDDKNNPAAEGTSTSKSRESRSSARDDDQSSKMRRSKSTGRRVSADGEGGANGRRKPVDGQDDVSAGEESKSSENKPSRESRSSSRDDPSGPTKRSKSTARSKSKGPSGRSKEDPSVPKSKGTRTVVRMSTQDLIDAGYDPANLPSRPKSAGKSKGGKERMLVSPGFDAKEMANRVLEKRKGKKKTKDELKEVPKEESTEEPIEEPFAVSDFNLGP